MTAAVTTAEVAGEQVERWESLGVPAFVGATLVDVARSGWWTTDRRGARLIAVVNALVGVVFAVEGLRHNDLFEILIGVAGFGTITVLWLLRARGRVT